MKAHQFGILFTALALVIFLILDIKTCTVKAVLREKNSIDNSLTSAVDDGVNAMKESFNKRVLIGSRDAGINSFFLSLYATLSITSDPVAQQNLRLYIPAVVVTDTDGLYVFFHDEYKSSGNTSVAMRWSERFPYTYEDEYFIYNFSMNDTVQIYDYHHFITDNEPYLELDFHEFRANDTYRLFRINHPDYFLLDDESFYLVRKEAIIQTINEKIAYYINQHNTIASQYGISYNFSLPVIDESELLRSIEQPGMIVIFQGYPLRHTNETYNRVEIAGAQIYRDEVYYLEDQGWYKIYHKSSCKEIGVNTNIDISIAYHSIHDCVNEGAYACKKCCPEGVYVPEYHIN